MSKWMVYAKKADFNEIGNALGITPFLARIIRNRDVVGVEETAAYLNGTLKDLHSPLLLHDLDRAVEILYTKIAEHKKIRVIGDYDVDGICSSFILWRMLSFLGAEVDVHLPHRMQDGYGINVRLVEEAIADGVDTILTCDNGIAATEPLKMAKEAGLTVIVTDHHEVPYETQEDGTKQFILPPADAIIEPKIVNPETGNFYYPFTEICGAVVTFKLAQVMLDQPDISGEKKERETPQQSVLRELLTFAALATICDVMPLVNENRNIVRQGLLEAERTENIGLQALIFATGLADQHLTTYHAGFVIGPCLNASGRLDSAERSFHLFMEQDDNVAMQTASELTSLNESRKTMTEEGTQKAEETLQAQIARQGELDRVLVVVVPNCHESIAGIIAGRIREKYERPTFVLTESAEDPNVLKGSGRSIEAYDMYTEMNRVADVFLKFGGHKMAAGLSIAKGREEELRKRLNENCTLVPEELQDTLHIDMELPLRFTSLDFVREIGQLEPFGTGNPKPVFVTRNLTMTLKGVFGKNQNVLKLIGQDETGRTFDCVYFARAGAVPEVLLEARQTPMNVVYEPDVNVWNGRESLQFVIKDFKTL